jgi:transcriptional regulator with XRE-family HTH domain
MDVMRITFEVEVEGVGKLLRDARKAAGLTQDQAGVAAGMSGANFSRLENEDTKGTPLETLLRAASAVGLDLKAHLNWLDQVPGVQLEDEN